MPQPTPLYQRLPTGPAIERIYDAAFDPQRLRQAIEAIAAATGARGGMLGVYDVLAGGGHARAIGGLDPALLTVYEARFQLNPWTRWVARHARCGHALSCEPQLPIARVAAEDPGFHDTILKPQQIVAQSFFLIGQQARHTVGLALMHTVPGRSAQREVLRRHTLFGRHLTRAVDLMIHLDTLQARLRAAEAALDAVRCAVIVVDARRTIVFANRAAERLLADGDGLWTDGRRLRARHAQDEDRLDAVIGQAAVRGASAAANGGAGWLRIRRAVDRLPLTGVALAATETRSPFDAAVGRVLLFVADPAAPNGVAAQLLRHAFGLTEREIAVALATVRLGGLPDAASDLGISCTTARTHLQHVFDKTGARNQVALAQLVAALGALPRGGEGG